MIGYITREKESRQKELMKMMSVTESDIGWSWFMTFFLLYFVTGTLTAIMAIQLFVSSDGFLMWIFWMFSFLSFIVYCMFISSLSSKATRAILIGELLFFAGFFLTLVVDYTDASSGALTLITLHPVAAFSYGLKEIGRLEDLGIGITSTSIDYSDNPSGVNFRSLLNNLIADTILWGILTWYFTRVINPDFGQALPFYFPFTPAYWGRGRAVVGDSDLEHQRSLEMSSNLPIEPAGEILERQAEEGESIEIRGLCKTFGDKLAVNDLNLSFYKGQITALLGHNGTCIYAFVYSQGSDADDPFLI
jgi:ATP-binding cassette, subfamily A (ABC1), member 3